MLIEGRVVLGRAVGFAAEKNMHRIMLELPFNDLRSYKCMKNSKSRIKNYLFPSGKTSDTWHKIGITWGHITRQLVTEN